MAFIVKSGANIRGLNPVMRKAIDVADDVYTKHGKTLVITSGLDGTHKPMSYHYFALAIDLRTSYFTPDEAKVVAGEIQAKLGFPYEVVVETDHLHLEWDFDKAQKKI